MAGREADELAAREHAGELRGRLSSRGDVDAELAVDHTDVVCRVGDNPRLERDRLGEETDEQRDYQAEIVELFSDGKWRTPKEIAAPRKDDGIGANVDTVKKLLGDVTRRRRPALDEPVCRRPREIRQARPAREHSPLAASIPHSRAAE